MIGYVFYTDGGCRPNPGHGGNGIHGYKWDSTITVKGIGHTTMAATVGGYLPKGEAQEFLTRLYKDDEAKIADVLLSGTFNNKVSVVEYYDGYNTMSFGATNNTAELRAATIVLEQFKKKMVEEKAFQVVLRIDSMYVVRGANDNLPNWIANNWMTQNMEPVKNPDFWMAFASIKKEYDEAGIRVVIQHVDGHSGDLGNDSADHCATTGVFKSRVVEEHIPVIHTTPSAGYWSPASENRHPFLSHRFAYFSTEEGHKPENIYYTGNQGKVVDELGKKVSDGGYALVKINKSNHFISLIEKTQCSLNREIDYLTMVDVDALYSSTNRYLNLYGADFLHTASHKKQDLIANDGTLVTKMLHPPYLAERVIDNMGILGDVLEAYETGLDFVTIKDITETFYDISVENTRKKLGEAPEVKTVYTLKPNIAVGYGTHVVEADYRTKEGEIGSAELRLTMGIDLLDRNNLRKLESNEPKVRLVTWKAGEHSFQYAVVIEAGVDIGIWASVNANIRVVSPKA